MPVKSRRRKKKYFWRRTFDRFCFRLMCFWSCWHLKQKYYLDRLICATQEEEEARRITPDWVLTQQESLRGTPAGCWLKINGVTHDTLQSWSLSPVSGSEFRKVLISPDHFTVISQPLVDKVMSRTQWHIGAQERHLVLEGPMQMNYSVLVFTHFCAMVMFQFS